MQHDENIREMQTDDGLKRLEVKKYGMWWPAYQNKDGEVYPDLVHTGYLDEEDMSELTNEKFEEMLDGLKKSGIKEIDFSNWSFEDIYFDQESMEFADKISFRNAIFRHGIFANIQMKNADFSGAIFDKAVFFDSTFQNCNFGGANFLVDDHYPDVKSHLKNSSFIGCNFKKAKLEGIELKNSTFSACTFDKVRIKARKPSILNKLDKFKQVVAENAKVSLGISRDAKQNEHNREER